MKKIILLLVYSLFYCFNSYSQTDSIAFFQFKDNYYIGSNVEIVDGFSKADLYKNALLWISKQYDSNNVEIQTKDTENGLLVIKGISKLNKVARHKLTLQFKDGRYKWEISEIYFFLNMPNMPELNRSAEKRFSKELGSNSSLNSIYKNFIDLIRDMEKSMILKEIW